MELLITTLNSDSKRNTKPCGIVAREVVLDANVFKDFVAGARDFTGGGSVTNEKERVIALEELQEYTRERATP